MSLVDGSQMNESVMIHQPISERIRLLSLE